MVCKRCERINGWKAIARVAKKSVDQALALMLDEHSAALMYGDAIITAGEQIALVGRASKVQLPVWRDLDHSADCVYMKKKREREEAEEAEDVEEEDAYE